MWRSVGLLAVFGAVLTGCQMPAPVQVMTFNIRYGAADDGPDSWPHRTQLVFDTIQAHAPDILGVQEALDFQVDALAGALPEYAWVGVGRDDGATQGEFCPIYFKKDRFKLTDSGHFWLSEDPHTPGTVSWDSSMTRMATWVRLQFRDSPQNHVYVINTHFDHRGRTARLESARLIRKMVDSLGGHPVIVTGDFNARVGSAPFRELTADRGNHAHLSDTLPDIPPGDPAGGTFNGFERSRPGRIDWILVNRRFTVLDAAIDRRTFDGRLPSDHYPVIATVELLGVTRHPGM